MTIPTAKLSLRTDPDSVFGKDSMQNSVLSYLINTGPKEPSDNPFPALTSAQKQAPGYDSTIARTIVINFPYTPTIRTGSEVMMTSLELMHTNYQTNAYNRTQVQSIQLQAKFTSQTDIWAKYNVAVIHFLRTVTKMRFGEKDTLRGAPPPVLNFSAYGDYIFKNVPVLVKSFQITLPDDVDYMETNISEGNLSKIHAVPVLFAIDLDLVIQQPLKPIRNEFTVSDFTRGKLTNKGYI